MVPLIAKKGRTLTAKGDMQVLLLPLHPHNTTTTPQLPLTLVVAGGGWWWWWWWRSP
jgi:hypothetical protein